MNEISGRENHESEIGWDRSETGEGKDRSVQSQFRSDASQFMRTTRQGQGRAGWGEQRRSNRAQTDLVTPRQLFGGRRSSWESITLNHSYILLVATHVFLAKCIAK